MAKEKTHHDVIPAIVNYLDEAFFQEDIQELPIHLQEIFELFLETEQANCQKVRVKMIHCLYTVRNLSNCLKPFTKEQVQTACKEFNS